MKWYPVDEKCLRMNTADFPYEEICCSYKTYGKTCLSWENEADVVPVRDWMVERPWLPVIIVLLYLLLIIAGKSYFKTRPAWNWRSAMAAWNLSLSVFSAIGFLRTAPRLFLLLRNYTWKENLCMDPESHFGSGNTGLWVQLFVLSKIPELIDTFFIVIHKKPLIFLHWYHHVSVLLYCWHSYVRKAPAGIFFCTMNYAVHAIMYGYYFLMAMKWRPKWFNPVYVTVAQISQMIVGCCLTVAGCYLWADNSVTVKTVDRSSFEEDPEECSLKPDNNLAALAMYGSYLFLFLQFFVGRYFFKDKKKNKGQEKKQN